MSRITSKIDEDESPWWRTQVIILISWWCNIYVNYYLSLFNIRIHYNIHLFIHVIQYLFFSLFFLCMHVRILSSKIYFMGFFLASLLIALIYYFYSEIFLPLIPLEVFWVLRLIPFTGSIFELQNEAFS